MTVIYDDSTPRSCSACGAALAGYCEEPDPCLGWLPGVDAACCGHGEPVAAYVCVRGQAVRTSYAALDWFATLVPS